MEQRTGLGDFLQSRRARLSPGDAGLRSYGERRRVPGLRREELAQLAGVSVSYYARLEQGQSANASDEVLDALARALRLDADEQAHLRDLARPRRGRAARRPRAERPDPALRRLVEAMTGVPAVLSGRSGDVLAWNRLAHALLAGHLDLTAPERPSDRPNIARMVFLDAHTRELFVDWPAKARAVVAHLRMMAGRYPEDPGLTALIGELTVGGLEFARFWARHPVRTCEPATLVLRHPVVGRLTVEQQVLVAPAEPDQFLVTITAEPGSPDEAALTLLGALAG